MELAIRMLRAGVLVSRLMRADRSPDHLPGSTMSLLRMLHTAGPMRLDALLAAGLRQPVSVRDLVEELRRQGWVAVRSPGGGGGDADADAEIEVTAAGRAAYQGQQRRIAAPLTDVLGTLDEAEMRLLQDGVRLLERLAQAGAPALPAVTP